MRYGGSDTATLASVNPTDARAGDRSDDHMPGLQSEARKRMFRSYRVVGELGDEALFSAILVRVAGIEPVTLAMDLYAMVNSGVLETLPERAVNTYARTNRG